jgi:hypothetical protein
MSENARTTGIARIEVNSPNQVTVTQRVVTVGGGVAWLVHNNTNSPVTVCVNNFQPLPISEKKAPFQATFLLPQNHCTGTLEHNQIGVIAAQAKGYQGQVFTYEVTVNGHKTTDPELEI